jgi:flavodoxin
MSNNGSHIAAPMIAIAYHSGFGHTAVLADAVAAGAREAGAHVAVIAVDTMTDDEWGILDGADAIVFGCATYMGNVSAGFQTFAEQTGRRCMNGTWRDKVAAGSASKTRYAGKNRFLSIEQCLRRAGIGRQDLVYPEYPVADLASNREYEDDVGVGPLVGVRLRLLNLHTVAHPKLLDSDRRALRRGRRDHRCPRRWRWRGPRCVRSSS